MPVLFNHNIQYLNESTNQNWKMFECENDFYKRWDHDNLLIIYTQWMSETVVLKHCYDFLNESSSNKVLLVATWDPSHVCYNSSRIQTITANEMNYWLFVSHRFLERRDLAPSSFKYKFLCYQRKINEPRKHLYDTLKNLKDGFINLGLENTGNINEGINSEDTLIDGDLPPNDIYTLGNKDIWDSSFLNIVSETSTFDFLSEKTFKPIMGCRPFIHYAFTNSNNILQSLGFETFNEDFDFDSKNSNYMVSADKILDVVNSFSLEDCNQLYQKLRPKIEHNYHQVDKAIDIQLEYLDSIVMNLLERH